PDGSRLTMTASAHTIRILMQTTIPLAQDDWHVGRFSLLAGHLRACGHSVDCRNRRPNPDGDDDVLCGLGRPSYDELWLFAGAGDNGLTPRDVEGINAFLRRGGGLLTARDHQDLGLCLRGIGAVGEANYFHRFHSESDPSRQAADDRETPSIEWPNYRS